jgi:putative membrane protein
MRTTWKSILPLVALLACGRGEEPVRQRAATVRRDTASDPRSVTDPQAVQILTTIDQARQIAAQVVRTKSENEAVLEYARVVMSDHAAMTAVLDSVLAAAGQKVGDHPLSLQLRMAAEQFAAQIAARDTGVNNAYIAREVADHERALQLFTAVLLPNAQNPHLKNALEQIAPAYHAHLQRARQIRAERQTSAARAPAPAREPLLGRPRRDTIR